MTIKPYGQAYKEATFELGQYQKGDKLLIDTRFPMLEGLKVGDIVLIGGPSFAGKTFFLNDIKDDVMNVDLNPRAGNYVWLSNSLEMTNLNTLLRDLSKALNKPKKDILTQQFNEMERNIASSIRKSKSDGRFYINEETFGSHEFDTKIREFLEEHKDKDAVVIDIDHLRFIKAQNKKSGIDEVMEYQNTLKKAFPNVIFIDLMQFNREIIGRAADKSELAKVQRLDFSDTDTAFTTADFVIGINTPFALGIEQYRLVSPSFYDYLTDHFGEFNSKGTKVSFKTHGRIFYEVLKSRFVDGFNAKNLFIKQIESDPIDVPNKVAAADKKAKPSFKDDVINLPFKTE